ncbi:MAG: hypothetical protein R3B52_01445 [Candidatus Paceibacterota bacterium]
MLAKKITKKIFAAAMIALVLLSLLPISTPWVNVALADDETEEGASASANINPPSAADFAGTSVPGIGEGNGFFDLEGIDIKYGQCDKSVTDVYCWILVGFKSVTMLFLSLVGKIGALILTFGSWMVYTMVKYGITIITLPIITAGFKVSLSLTNLFFVIAIIVMAFGTMLRSKSYNIKNQLKRLIFAAILVNFSFLIAGLFIDVSNVLTANFLQSIHPDKIGGALQPQSLLSIKNAGDFEYKSVKLNDEGTKVSSGLVEDEEAFKLGKDLKFNINNDETGWSVWFKLVQALILADIITWLMAGVLVAIGIMVLVRNIWIATLLIFMPLVWALGLIPRLSEYQKKWWDNFIKWLIYLPTVTFFVFLAISTMLVTSRSGGLLGTDFFNNVMQILVLLGLLWAAMKAGKAGGVMGAGLAFGVGAFIGSRIPKTLGKVGLGGATRGTLKAFEATSTGAVAGIGSGLGAAGSKFGFNKLATVGSGIARFGKGAGKISAAPRKALGEVLDSKSRLKDIPKIAEDKLAWTEDFAVGKKSIPFGEKASQEATLKFFNDQYKDKSKPEALDMLSKIDTMSSKEKAALGMLLSKTNALSDVGAASGDSSFKNKKALLEAAYANGSVQLAESIARGLSEKDPEFAAIAKALKDKNTKARTEDQKESRKIAKGFLAKARNDMPSDLTEAENKIIKGIFESLDAKKIADLPIKDLGDTAQKYALAQAMKVRGATAMIMNAKASTQEAWIQAIEESLGKGSWQTASPEAAAAQIQTQINAIRSQGGDSKQQKEQIAKLTQDRDMVVAWHKLMQTPGDPGAGQKPSSKKQNYNAGADTHQSYT